MKNSEKKVVIVIAEGASEEGALGTVMKEFFAEAQVRFLIVHGDITARDYVSTDNIIKKINGQIDEVKEKYRYTTADFTRIIHLTDMDGVFIPDDRVWESDVPVMTYYEDHIDTRMVDSARMRNHRKADILFKLRRIGKIGRIPYSIYYNSCNLEHVLFGELRNFTAEEKRERSDEFADRYENRVEDFISFIKAPEVAVPGDYQETWDFIEKELNSLNRYSNMYQIFQPY